MLSEATEHVVIYKNLTTTFCKEISNTLSDMSEGKYFLVPVVFMMSFQRELNKKIPQF